jgi:hypothetical protein
MRSIILFALSVFFAGSLSAQIRNVVIDSVNEPNEPCIAIDPKNPMHMVAGSNVNNVYTSVNGGLTWRRDTLSSSYGVFGDPVIIADTSGSFYYFHLANNTSRHIWPEWCDRMVCQRMDNIATGVWTNGSYAGLNDSPKVEDKPWVAVDLNSNNLYMAWTRFDRYGSHNPADSSNILFAKSTDKGNTWSTPLRLNRDAGDCSDQDPTVEGAVPCVGPHGEVFVIWASYNSILFDRSYDGGRTWLDNDLFVTSVPGGWYYDVPGITRGIGLPYAACDISNSPYRGTIYVNWTDQRYGTNNTDVWVTKSTDNGDTWTTPIKVNDDAGAKQQFLSSMTVDPVTGYIYVLFYDRRNYADTSVLTDVYLAVSKDGAGSFQNYKISSAPFRPTNQFFFGDYTYVSAFNNVVRPIWGSLNVPTTSPFIVKQKIVTAIIDSTITGTSVGEVYASSYDLRVYPNPVIENTSFSYRLAAPEEVFIYLTDISGRKVAVLKNNETTAAGAHTEQLSAKSYGLAPGLYFLSFRTPTYAQTVKIVVTR